MTSGDASRRSAADDDLPAHARAMSVRERGMEHAPEPERPRLPESPILDLSGRQVVVERPVVPVGGYRVRAADGFPLDGVAPRDANRRGRPVGDDPLHGLRRTCGCMTILRYGAGRRDRGQDEQHDEEERCAGAAR